MKKGVLLLIKCLSSTQSVIHVLMMSLGTSLCCPWTPAPEPHADTHTHTILVSVWTSTDSPGAATNSLKTAALVPFQEDAHTHHARLQAPAPLPSVNRFLASSLSVCIRKQRQNWTIKTKANFALAFPLSQGKAATCCKTLALDFPNQVTEHPFLPFKIHACTTSLPSVLWARRGNRNAS